MSTKITGLLDEHVLKQNTGYHFNSDPREVTWALVVEFGFGAPKIRVGNSRNLCVLLSTVVLKSSFWMKDIYHGIWLDFKTTNEAKTLSV